MEIDTARSPLPGRTRLGHAEQQNPILSLQHQFRNRAVQRLFSSAGNPGFSPVRLRQPGQPTIQRQVDFGLATGENVGGYAGKVKDFKNAAANQGKSFEDLARFAADVEGNPTVSRFSPAVHPNHGKLAWTRPLKSHKIAPIKPGGPAGRSQKPWTARVDLRLPASWLAKFASRFKLRR